jgi:hypothetical protein
MRERTLSYASIVIVSAPLNVPTRLFIAFVRQGVAASVW